MRAFVTGGSGFVGQALIASLRRRGAEVRALARSERAAHQVQALGAEPWPGDLDDAAALEAGARDRDVVFHAAANVDDWGRLEDFRRINVAGTARLLEAARRGGVARFVHVSTEAVLLGGRPLVGADETWPRPVRPLGAYPLTKGLAEQSVIAANSDSLATVVVRPRLVWGPGDTSVLPKLVEAVRRGRFAWIDGGKALTSTCHVENAAEALGLAAERGRPGNVYFVTDGEPIEVRRFLSALLATQGVVAPERSIPLPLARALAAVSEAAWRVLRLPGAPPLTRTAVRLIGEEVTVDDGKARRELGYRPVVEREAGLRALVEARGAERSARA